MFGKKELPKSSASFNEKANQILGIFTITKNQLASLVKEQEAYYQELAIEKARIEMEQTIVTEGIHENSIIISRIDDFLK